MEFFFLASEQYVKPIALRVELFENLSDKTKAQLGGKFDPNSLLRSAEEFERLAEEYYRAVSTRTQSQKSKRWNYIECPVEINEGEQIDKGSRESQKEQSECLKLYDSLEHREKIKGR